MRRHPTILDLEPGHCKWPISQDHKGVHRFCNAPQTASGPYCAQHRAKAYGYTPEPRADRGAGRVAR